VLGNSSDPQKRILRISTSSTATVNYTATVNAAWVRLSGAAGRLSAAAPEDLEISIDSAWFPAPGDYTARVLVSAPGLTPPTAGADVRVHVVGPRISVASFRNAASGEPGLVAGSLATVTGNGLATGLNGCVSSESVIGPLPTRLAGVEIVLGEYPAPILLVCNLNGEEFATVQTPFELGPGTVWARVEAAGGAVLLSDVPVLPVQPGILEASVDGKLRAVVAKPDGSLVSTANPLGPGQRATAFVTGLGPVLPLAHTNVRGVPGQLVYFPVAVRINNSLDVWPLISQYAPNMIGVYQVTFEVPANAPTGPDIPFVIAAQPGAGQFWVFAHDSSIAVAP
jgi:uncharacterized protein (TIGR03437 family)